MFRIKICGITTVEDATLAAAAGADAVGINFFAKSPRFVDPERAAAILAALPASVVKVGLFVNHPADEIRERFRRLALDLVQLHGDEPPPFLAELSPMPVLRAFRLGAGGLASALIYLNQCQGLGCVPQAVLFDAYASGQYGGGGRPADWTMARQYPSESWHPPLVLAGGLTAENVAEAIRMVGPAAVDTASGVESSPGKKDPARTEQFVRAAREAFARARR